MISQESFPVCWGVGIKLLAGPAKDSALFRTRPARRFERGFSFGQICLTI